MDVETSITVGDDVESLGESELFCLISVHAEMSDDEDNDGTGDRALLDIGAHVGVLDRFEGEGLYFFGDLFEAGMLSAGVGHPAAFLVEVDEGLSLLSVELHDLVVFVEEHV